MQTHTAQFITPNDDGGGKSDDALYICVFIFYSPCHRHRLLECNTSICTYIHPLAFVFISSSSVSTYHLLSRRRRFPTKTTLTTTTTTQNHDCCCCCFCATRTKNTQSPQKRENDRFPVDRARWFPRAHRVSSFLERHFFVCVYA